MIKNRNEKYCPVISSLAAKIFFCIIITSFSITSTSAQDINGVVLSSESGDPIENVNVYLSNSSIGTTTNTQGFFSLKLKDKLIGQFLVISHLAYQEKILRINTGYYSDTLSILLDKATIVLNEAVISAQAKNLIKKREVSVFDFNFLNENTLILMNNFSSRRMELVLLNSVFDTIAFSNDAKLKRAKSIFKDCLGNCHIVLKDSVCQVVVQDSSLLLMYPTHKIRFNKILGDCLFEVDQNMVFKTTSIDGYSNSFYAVDIETRTRKNIFSYRDIDKVRSLNFEINYILNHPDLYRNIGDCIEFERRVMHRPSSIEMIYNADTMYLFDHTQGNLDIYMANFDYSRSLTIDYNTRKGWNKYLIHDAIDHKIYTTFQEKNFETLYEINLTNGSIIKKHKIAYVFPFKVMVNSGYVFVLYNDFTNPTFRKCLYVLKL